MTTEANAASIASAQDYPLGATPVFGSSGNVAAANAVATLIGAPGKQTYLTGFVVSSTGATAAAIVLLTIAGVFNGSTISLVYATVAGATTPNPIWVVTFPKPLPTQTLNTNIVVTLPSLGAGNTNATVVAFGYLL